MLPHLIPQEKSLRWLCEAFWLHLMPFELHIKVETFIARNALMRADLLVLFAMTS